MMISVQVMPFRLWIVQEAPYFIPSDYVVRELSLSAIFMSSPEVFILVSFCSGVNTRVNQMLTKAAQVQRIVKNSLTTSYTNSNL